MRMGRLFSQGLTVMCAHQTKPDLIQAVRAPAFVCGAKNGHLRRPAACVPERALRISHLASVPASALVFPELDRMELMHTRHAATATATLHGMLVPAVRMRFLVAARCNHVDRSGPTPPWPKSRHEWPAVHIWKAVTRGIGTSVSLPTGAHRGEPDDNVYPRAASSVGPAYRRRGNEMGRWSNRRQSRPRLTTSHWARHRAAETRLPPPLPVRRVSCFQSDFAAGHGCGSIDRDRCCAVVMGNLCSFGNGASISADHCSGSDMRAVFASFWKDTERMARVGIGPLQFSLNGPSNIALAPSSMGGADQRRTHGSVRKNADNHRFGTPRAHSHE